MRSIQETLPWEDAALKIRCFTLRGRLGVPSYCHWHNEVEIVYSRTGSGIQQIIAGSKIQSCITGGK